MILVGRVGGDGRHFQPLEQPLQGSVEIGVDALKNLVEMGHGRMQLT
jgi:hypothetical protein